MRNYDHNRVEFYSIDDLAAGHQLSKGEHILNNDLLHNYTDINDVIELYNIKKFFDYELRLNKWSDEESHDSADLQSVLEFFFKFYSDKPTQ